MKKYKALSTLLRKYHESDPEIVIEGFQIPNTNAFIFIYHNRANRVSYKVTSWGIDEATAEIKKFLGSNGKCYEDKTWSAELHDICRGGDVTNILQWELQNEKV